jgi:hypothetical protein
MSAAREDTRDLFIRTPLEEFKSFARHKIETLERFREVEKLKKYVDAYELGIRKLGEARLSPPGEDDPGPAPREAEHVARAEALEETGMKATGAQQQSPPPEEEDQKDPEETETSKDAGSGDDGGEEESGGDSVESRLRNILKGGKEAKKGKKKGKGEETKASDDLDYIEPRTEVLGDRLIAEYKGEEDSKEILVHVDQLDDAAPKSGEDGDRPVATPERDSTGKEIYLEPGTEIIEGSVIVEYHGEDETHPESTPKKKEEEGKKKKKKGKKPPQDGSADDGA